jgi:opacity protein-like surface antigen
MRQMLGVILAVAWLLHPADARAQPRPERPDKAEIFGNIGYGKFSNGNSVWGEGLDYGGGICVQPFPGSLHGVGFEVQMVRMNSSQDLGGGSSQDLDARLIAATVVYHFGSRAALVQPYAFGGLGYVMADYTHRCADCVFDRDPVTGALVSRGVIEERIESSKVGLAFGAGANIAVHRRLSVRPEVLLADTTAGSGWNWGWVRLQVGLGVHF